MCICICISFILIFCIKFQLDDWVLCRIRQKNSSVTQRKDNHETHKRSFSPCNDLEAFEDKITLMDQKKNYFKNFELKTQEGDVADEKGQFSFQGGCLEHSLSYINSDPQAHTACSMKEALESIRRVLSLGALDEQAVPFPPDKRLCSYDSFNNYICDI